MNTHTAADFAVRRKLLGLSMLELSEVLRVRKDTIAKWEDEIHPIPPGIWNEMENLLNVHEEAATRFSQEKSVTIPKNNPVMLSAAARALAINPQLAFRWKEESAQR